MQGLFLRLQPSCMGRISIAAPGGSRRAAGWRHRIAVRRFCHHPWNREGNLIKNLTIMAALAVIALCADLIVSDPAKAQMTCGAGTTFNPAHTPTNGLPVCIPINDWSSPPPSAPQGRWEKRWGAFAYDPEMSKVGMAGGMSGRGKAIKAAMAHCQAKGGVDCRLMLAYYNQCAVAGIGLNGNGPSYVMFRSAATLEEANGIALDDCRKNGSSDCKVVFSDCSYAEFVN